jgi:hypothetical protein
VPLAGSNLLRLSPGGSVGESLEAILGLWFGSPSIEHTADLLIGFGDLVLVHFKALFLEKKEPTG